MSMNSLFRNTAERIKNCLKKAAVMGMCITMAGSAALPASLPAEAASVRKCYTISSSNTTVYSNTGLTSRYGAIYGSDEVTVLDVQSRYCKVSYPTSKGSKTGYIPTSAILTKTTGSDYRASAKITTYKRPGGSSYGYIASNDIVKVLGERNGYTQVKYPVSGGYKYAFITNSDCSRYIKGGGSSSGTSSAGTLTNALYKINVSGSKITCGFDGYKNTKGRHEGIDFVYYQGAAVYSLADGVVTNVVRGYNGSGGLSTIAIYNSTYNKTIIYLHSAPLSGIKTGQSIRKGQQIATEAYRGVSSSSSGHTHVEVRSGRCTNAAKSVNDYKLDNANPTSFFNSLGYIVK